MTLNYGFSGYYNPYLPQPQQATQIPQPQQVQTQQNTSTQIFPALYVSSKNEVEGIRPDQNNNPMYFHNRAAKEIYLKQYDSTGAAPILTFKLVEKEEKEEDFTQAKINSLELKIDKLLNLFEEKEEKEEKRSKK